MAKNKMSVISENMLCEAKISYTNKVAQADRTVIKNSQDIADFLRAGWDPGTVEYIEELKVIYLNRQNQVLCFQTISKGGLSGTVADPRVIFMTAIKCAASSLILAHNHPSGNRNPSPEDRALTKKIIAGAKLLDMRVLDHIILTGASSYISFADHDLL